MYKLIAIDLDGTLLNSYGEVSKENKEAIRFAQSKNIEVVIASGRMPKAIISIAEEINANKYIISGNGSLIQDIQKNEIIYSNYLSKEKVLEIINTCEKNSMFYSVYTNNMIITKALNYNMLFYHNENKKKTDDKKININVMEDIYKYVEQYESKDFLKVTVCDNSKTVFKSIINKLRQIRGIDILEVAHMSKKIIRHGSSEYELKYYYTEIANKNVNKWKAIKKLIEKIGVKEKEVLAIGDNINDIEMIKKSGCGIATKNSSPEVKEIADSIVSDNNQNGVAEAIYDNLR